MLPNEILALINSSFNALSATFAITGYVMIRRGERERHRKMMLAALTSSSLFLVGYLTRIVLYGDTKFPGTGVWRPIFFTILISHVTLALVTLPLVLRTAYLAWKGRFEQHRRIAKVALPIWAYVSITGVVVYLMVYQWPKG